MADSQRGGPAERDIDQVSFSLILDFHVMYAILFPILLGKHVKSMFCRTRQL